MNPLQAMTLLTRAPAQIGRWCGFTRLNDTLHGGWIRDMLSSPEDMTLLAHRGSYKTTCLAMAIAISMIIRPKENILFLRKTDDDADEIIRQVKKIIGSDAMKYLSAQLYGNPALAVKSAKGELTLSSYAAPRGAAQLLGCGASTTLTGKHAGLILTDDIVNLKDRVSAAERTRTRQVYMELQNIRTAGGRIVNIGTPWHKEDAISLMPNVRKFDCYTTGLLTADELTALRQAMSPALFAANYELQHIAGEDALFGESPLFTDDAHSLRDGVAHIDASYGGGDYTALTCGKREGDVIYLYGRLWHSHADLVRQQCIAICEKLMCAPIWCETNGDKGYYARALRTDGAAVRPYHEQMNKHLKISTFLRKWWKNIVFLEGTDEAYINQILDYTPFAAHDDAPDSAACICRILDKRE